MDTLRTALLVVDVQNDFLPGGALGVPAGDEVIGPLNRCIDRFASRGWPVFYSRDWHPPDHCSFKAQGGSWPPHCVAGKPGAELALQLHRPAESTIISKATRPERDAYSAFDGTSLLDELRNRDVKRLLVGGLATDYCVLSSVRDARKNGFEVDVLTDAVRGIDAAPGDIERALREMREAGARLTDTSSALAEL